MEGLNYVTLLVELSKHKGGNLIYLAKQLANLLELVALHPSSAKLNKVKEIVNDVGHALLASNQGSEAISHSIASFCNHGIEAGRTA